MENKSKYCYNIYKTARFCGFKSAHPPERKESSKLTNNMPKVKIGIVAVSRDCFPESLSVNRRKAVVQSYIQHYNSEDIYECPVCIVESEIQMVQALEDIKQAGCNALCVYLGNFGPEIAETLLAKHFDGH